ncbi:phenylalanine--tRNA ligase subunit beta [Pontiella sulfatireligans]|uniref:Phenylalanine--tRNA ligase beta subunit n=1 Tax=Pontiella sulfatireligans TaxID=2750658 RepID=A0A6C2UQD2_9BACT|nr:phenylalanine--tRNA ligase subunit beta [Pontiella sulfatireligans]VGO22502.1 Phenylalanine--tRNA ligase beta subunit [Pontiella sulfatireligans]
MKVLVSWLKEYVDFEDTIEGLSDKLTFAGLEVEAIETIGSDFSGVVVGEVIHVEPHPGADKLRMCTVEYGAEETMRVVCGAPNVEIGGKYPFAPVGTTLPCGITLKKAKIRGEVSMGMLCAKDELSLGEDHSGLLVLDAGLAPGTPFVEVWGEPDTVIELEITPNRPDCLSMIGVAREMAVLYGSELKVPAFEISETGEDVNAEISVVVEDAGKCPRYTARVLKDAKVGPSPEWMQKCLEGAGIRPISNIVDITNYVMLETGHPLHAFDKDTVAGGQIIVRTAKPGEKMHTLDGVERELTEDMLVIADAEKASAVGGVMGGGDSEIKDGTSIILLEAAAFETSTIRHTAKKLGLITDASYRFQRGVNTDSVEWASRRAASLMCELAGASLCQGVVDAYPGTKEQIKIPFSWKRIEGMIGAEIPAEKMKGIFRTLEIGIEDDNGETAVAVAPSFRLDLEREVDLVEEIARIHGVDNIPAKIPLAKVIPTADDSRVRSIAVLRNNLQGLGVSEILNYTLVNHPLLDLLNKDDRESREELPHPISVDQSVLRTSLIPQLVESLGRNHSRQVNEACFYELGRSFSRVDGAPVQTETVSLGMMGPVGRSLLEKRAPVSEEEMFVWMKGLVGKLLSSQKLTSVSFKAEDRPEFEAGKAVSVFVDGEAVGCMGLVNKTARDEWRLTGPVAAGEIKLETLLKNSFQVAKTQDLAQFPSMSRDIALVLDESVKNEDVVQLIEKSNPKDLECFGLFDVYQGKGIEKGKKSLAYTFVYRSARQTLTDKKVNKVHQKLIDFLCKQLGASLREG